MHNNRGKLIVLSGPSGTGKSTVVERLMKLQELHFSVSATTRQPRPGEIDGTDYYFVTQERFREMINDGELLEYATYVGNSYGTPKRPIQEQLAQGRNILLDVEVQGAMQVRQTMPEAILVFLAPPDLETLRQRLEGRDTDSQEKIEARLLRAEEELLYASQYDYIVINEDADEAAVELSAIITAESCRSQDRIQMIEVQLQ